MIARHRGWTLFVVLIVAVIVQTTLFGRVRLAGVGPDLVLLVSILGALWLAPTVSMLVGFAAGLLMDALGSEALGLRATVYTLVVYLALLTRERVDIGPVAIALWIGVLTLVGVLAILVLGSLFSLIELSGGEVLTRIVLIPLLNMIAGLVVSPLSVRLVDPRELSRRG